jgi:hypothetical protein
MVKRYQNFVKSIKESSEFETPHSIDGIEEKGHNFYEEKIQELADLLGVELNNRGDIDYSGETIIFPSETDMYHYKNNKFATAQEVYDFIKREESGEAVQERYRGNSRRNPSRKRR